MRARFQKSFCCKLSFMLVLLFGLCQVTQAQTFPVVHTPFPGDTSGAQVDIGLSVSFNASGYSVPLLGGGTGLFHYLYAYSVTMNDDVKLPTTFITDFEVLNCLSTLFVAQSPTVLAPPLIGASHPELFTVPIWSLSSPQIIWSGPVAGPAYMATWSFSFYSDIAPGLGTVSVTGTRINQDCSIDHPTITIPYFGPCGGPGAPPPVCKTPICNAGGPYIATAGVPVTFDGSGSSGNGSAITGYSWNFGDGSFGTGVSPTHTHLFAGTYTVSLTVTNNCGQSCSCSTRVTISNPPQAPPPCPPHLINIAQVYPALVAPSPFPFKQLGCFIGDTSIPFPSLSVPGILCLDTLSDNKLATNSFITCCPGGVVALQSVKLVKTVPGSEQFPGCYRPYTVTQLGRDNIRTWWTLNYTMPGTKFTLTLDGICNGPGNPGGGRFCPPGRPGVGASTPYSETWEWTVLANPETFLLLIDLFHTHELGLSEVPCIVDENIYDGLVAGAKAMKAAVKAYEQQRTAFNRIAAQDAIMSEEAFILANCLSADQLSSIAKQIKLPPGNFLPCGAGIFDTLENPCCCKMLVDLEALLKQLDVQTQ